MDRLRKLTLGEVAELAAVPKETLRARINRSMPALRPTHGWGRFAVPHAVQLCIHAELLRRGLPDWPALDASIYAGESIEDYARVPPGKIGRRGQLEGVTCHYRVDDHGIWHARRVFNADAAANLLGQMLADSRDLEASVFFTVNIGTLVDHALDRVFDLLGSTADEAGCQL